MVVFCDIWRSCLTYQHGLKESDKWSPKEHHCSNVRGRIITLSQLKLCRNVSLDDIQSMLEYGSYQVKKYRSLGQTKENFINTVGCILNLSQNNCLALHYIIQVSELWPSQPSCYPGSIRNGENEKLSFHSYESAYLIS